MDQTSENSTEDLGWEATESLIIQLYANFIFSIIIPEIEGLFIHKSYLNRVKKVDDLGRMTERERIVQETEGIQNTEVNREPLPAANQIEVVGENRQNDEIEEGEGDHNANNDNDDGDDQAHDYQNEPGEEVEEQREQLDNQEEKEESSSSEDGFEIIDILEGKPQKGEQNPEGEDIQVEQID